MENITEEIMDFNTLEKRIFTIMCQIACCIMQQCLQSYDKIIKALRDTKEYRLIDPKRKRTIKTMMGEITYTRAYYKDKNGVPVFLLDEAIGISKEYGLVSENLAEQIVDECADKSFRKAANSISNLTGQFVSTMSAWGVVQRFGGKIEAQEKRLSELKQAGTEGQLGNVSTRVLFEEFDDVWLSMQKRERHKQGTPAEEKGKKAGKKPMHVGTAYTGWSQEKDGRYRIENKVAYASFGSVPGFLSGFETLLGNIYDMDGVERRVIGGDGDPWIRGAAEDCDAIFQLDPFHRSQAILRAISEKSDRKTIVDALNEKNVEKTLTLIYDLLTKAKDEVSLKKLGTLFGYFHSNKDSLLTWQERGVELPPPPDGVIYRNLGTQEPSNGNLITLRMKHRKGSWSPDGATNMAKILSFRGTIGLDTILGILPEAAAPLNSVEPLSAAKVPLYDGKGYDGAWLHADMPFEQVFMTYGREAIRGLLKQRPLSELSFF